MLLAHWWAEAGFCDFGCRALVSWSWHQPRCQWGWIPELLTEGSRAALGLLVCRAVVWGALGLLPVCWCVAVSWQDRLQHCIVARVVSIYWRVRSRSRQSWVWCLSTGGVNLGPRASARPLEGKDWSQGLWMQVPGVSTAAFRPLVGGVDLWHCWLQCPSCPKVVLYSW